MSASTYLLGTQTEWLIRLTKKLTEIMTKNKNCFTWGNDKPNRESIEEEWCRSYGYRPFQWDIAYEQAKKNVTENPNLGKSLDGDCLTNKTKRKRKVKLTDEKTFPNPLSERSFVELQAQHQCSKKVTIHGSSEEIVLSNLLRFQELEDVSILKKIRTHIDKQIQQILKKAKQAEEKKSLLPQLAQAQVKIQYDLQLWVIQDANQMVQNYFGMKGRHHYIKIFIFFFFVSTLPDTP